VRLKKYNLHPSALKINCKSFCEVGYANFGQMFFATKRISMEIWLKVGWPACPVAKDL